MGTNLRQFDAGGPHLETAGALRGIREAQQGEAGDAGRQPTLPRPGRPRGIVHALISGCRRVAVKGRTASHLLALVAALLVAGCTGVKVVYDRLDVLLPWYFRDYLDLDTGQRGQLQRSIETLLAWHRESEVGRYATFFRELSAEAAAPLPPGRLEAARLELETFWDDVAKRVAPDAAGLLATLSEAQVAEMFERIAREDAKLARESLVRSPDERVARRERSLRRQIERWTGGLDVPQRSLVQACARDLQADTGGWLASRGRWQAALREAFPLRDDPAAFAARLERLFADGEEFWTPAYRDSFRADRRRVLQLLEDLDRSLSAAQRARLQQRLTEWALDLESIAGGA